eukprot:354470-Ditylum_brightwellii.AAC.1
MADRRMVEDLSKANKELAEAIPTTRFVPDPHGYCWSCGYNVDRKHNSVTCNKQKDGHQEAAIRSNPMGGSQKGKPQS